MNTGFLIFSQPTVRRMSQWVDLWLSMASNGSQIQVGYRYTPSEQNHLLDPKMNEINTIRYYINHVSQGPVDCWERICIPLSCVPAETRLGASSFAWW